MILTDLRLSRPHALEGKMPVIVRFSLVLVVEIAVHWNGPGHRKPRVANHLIVEHEAHVLLGRGSIGDSKCALDPAPRLQHDIARPSVAVKSSVPLVVQHNEDVWLSLRRLGKSPVSRRTNN